MEKGFTKINEGNCYLLKTFNGKYFQEYVDNGYISLYGLAKERDYVTFTNGLKLADYIVIPNHNNKKVSIGQITSTPQTVENKLIRQVNWLKTIPTKDLSPLYRYLKQNRQIILINDIFDDIIRFVYPSYYKDEKYHFVINITNQTGIPFKSLYGLYDIILSEISDEDIEIKTVLKSPGMIELITAKLETIILIMKLIKEIIILGKKVIDKNKDEALMKKYYNHQVDKLSIEIPDFTDFDNFNS